MPVRHLTPASATAATSTARTTRATRTPSCSVAERLEALLLALPGGATELGCHPGYADGLDTMYAAERERELDALCDPRRPRRCSLAEGIELRLVRRSCRPGVPA